MTTKSNIDMKTKYRLELENAIESVIEGDDHATDHSRGWTNDTLIDRMADAAEAVYDNTMEFQEWAKEEDVEL